MGPSGEKGRCESLNLRLEVGSGGSAASAPEWAIVLGVDHKY